MRKREIEMCWEEGKVYREVRMTVNLKKNVMSLE
jgi:hypothetical protein